VVLLEATNAKALLSFRFRFKTSILLPL